MSMTADALILRGQGLDLAGVVRVAREGARVQLSPEARARVRAARQVVERLSKEDRPIYGVTTGLGASKDVRLAAEDLPDLQRRVLLSRSVAVGPRFGTDVVRAMLVARANAMATGGSGITPEILDTLVAMLNAGVHPVVPSVGSIGAADLPQLAHLSLPLIGLGEAEYRGARLPGDEALRRAGLHPVALGPKDGLALVSSNAASVGHGALVLWDALAALEVATVAAGLSLEGFRGNLSPLDPRVQAARPAPGQGEVASRLRAILEGSDLSDAGTARSVQDPLSFRCVTQVHGAAQAAIAFAQESVEIELNSAGDNPLVLPDDGAILSTGNFHVPALALGFDLLGLALAQVASLATGRVIQLMSPAASGLPLFLSPYGGTRTGFATLQKTLTALRAEIRHLANPASLDFLPVSEGVEDHATMAPLTVRKAGEIVAGLTAILAIELMVAAQAVDLRDSLRLGRGTRTAYTVLREVVQPLDEDRVIGPDVERIQELITSGRFLAAVRSALPG
ncbi:MAG: histidine ammonia-lyase [candidate division NC10 bacterium RIFCSPLOWO2_12_FULL_66_18]|nr:MAG: histidine ammonia-lyase [candidate division NC10 bacterium RIFCSPLOWO2_02_FULL_66_22]OGB96403.1 MAG: histidine ammonia-lyase [candidate division NC10 bacterium RIFCSPLOWO2_12_FULL_66_18]